MASRGVHEPPFGAASSLLKWATDIWPYVNGRALVNGLQLASMPADDMLDVLHYFFEDDQSGSSTPEQAQAKDAMRSSMYESLYGSTYQYASQPTALSPSVDSETTDSSTESDDDINPMQQANNLVKAYQAPTQISSDSASPFGSVLDSPLN